MRIDGYSMPQQEYRKLTEAGFDELIADEIYLLTSPRPPIATPPPIADQCLSIAA
jgi:hypothetical protein